MIDNNLDFDIALYPYELVTYGETGQVCQNWMQSRFIHMNWLPMVRPDRSVRTGCSTGLSSGIWKS